MFQRFYPMRTFIVAVAAAAVVVAHILIPYLLRFTSSRARTESLFSHSNGIALKMRERAKGTKGISYFHIGLLHMISYCISMSVAVVAAMMMVEKI